MNAGAFKKIITIQKLSTTSDKYRNHIDTWTDWKRVYAYVNGLSGNEYWIAGHEKNESILEFVCRWNRLFDSMNTKEYRVIFNQEIYDIESIDNIQFRNQTVKLRGRTKHDKIS